MTRIDSSGAILALLGGFIVSAGLVGFILSAGGFQLPGPGASRIAAAGAAGVVVPAPAVAQAAAVTGSSAPADLKIVSTDLKFTPSTLQAKVGQPIHLVMENKGVIEHDLTLPTIASDKPAGSLKLLVKPGQSGELDFTPTTKGTYEYICTIPGHKAAGMKGTITVSN
jgi:uncharacterized cupredoxin-like copper-binding protein